MRKVALTGAATALVLALASGAAIAAASQAAEPSTHKAKTRTFHVVLSPFSPIAANNQRDPSSPFALGDELVFHDQLFANGKQVGDDVGSCVIAATTPSCWPTAAWSSGYQRATSPASSSPSKVQSPSRSP
jgi:hypothetical protein